MISTKNKKGFTLIELIVVITILAILGTIAFISLNGYTGQTRDAKRTTDLRSIQSKMELKIATAGTSLTSFVGTDNNTNTITAPSIQGKDASSLYKAGDVSFNQLDIKESDFKDPQNKSYVIGAYTGNGGAYELAASMEGDDETGKSAYVVGTYSPRTKASLSGSRSNSNLTITLSTPSNYGKIRKGDTVTTGGLVKSVSSDGKTITVSNALTSDAIELAVSETKGLIGTNGSTNSNADANVVENGSSTKLPY